MGLNQVAAAIKLVTLGQAAGRRLLSALQPALAEATDVALATQNEGVGRSMPGIVMASMKHARMYSLLFRS